MLKGALCELKTIDGQINAANLSMFAWRTSEYLIRFQFFFLYPDLLSSSFPTFQFRPVTLRHVRIPDPLQLVSFPPLTH
jgi:hypothetical protein